MKIIITEKQYSIIKENTTEIYIRRRINTLDMFISEAIDELDDPCGYSDEFQYADNIIDYAVSRFITMDEDMYDSEDLEDTVTQYLKETYADTLFDIFRNNCD
jgi:hypothetical protein